MKVTAINGSPRKNGNTAKALEIMAHELEGEGIETEIIHVGGEMIRGCVACMQCHQPNANYCVIDTDIVNEVTAKMRASDGYILGSPTYFGGITGTMKSILDRIFWSSYHGKLRYKVASVVTATRRASGVDVVTQLKHYPTLVESIIAPSQYWQVVYGAAPGEVLSDEEGVAVITQNARAMAWLLKMMKSTEAALPPPIFARRPRTNFIR